MNVAILEESLGAVRQELPHARPCCGIVLGSGWRDVAKSFTQLGALDYNRIPGLGAPQVAGHDGRLLWARHAGREVFVFLGRRHWYEGAGWEPVAIPVFLLRAFGAAAILLTNSAGGLLPEWAPSDLMVIDDHINAMGANPLTGPQIPGWGPRFPDLSQVYDAELRGGLDSAAHRHGIRLHHGVYAAVSGPSYETPAEIRVLRQAGAHAVGMSTVPEAILARAAGLRVAALSCITNAAAGVVSKPITHEEVLAAAARAADQGSLLLQDLVANLDRKGA